MVRGRYRGGFRRGNSHRRVPDQQFKRGSRPFRGRNFTRRLPTAEDLDRDLEQYWGEKVAAEHLDKDMDEYWAKNKKEEVKQ